MTPTDKAINIYSDAYNRWGLELSHDKNVLIAKSIGEYVCNEVLEYIGSDDGLEFWVDVRGIIRKFNHSKLYNGANRSKRNGE